MNDGRTRVFLPILPASLRHLDADGEVHRTTDAGYAVTGRLRSVMPSADDEDLEYAALSDAADASAELGSTDGSREPAPRAGEPAAPTHGDGIRRIVVAADVSTGSVTERLDEVEAPGGAPASESLVHVFGPLRRADVVSFHVGELGGGDDDELSWYDVSELTLVIELLS